MAPRPLGERRFAPQGSQRPRTDRQYLYGRNPVLEALRAKRRIHRLLLSEGAHGDAVDSILQEATRRNLPVERVPREQLDRMAGDEHHQGVLAQADPFAYTPLDALLESAEPALLLALDSVQDPQNLGTLIRTAQAVGTTGLILPEHRAAGVTPAVSRSSAGAVEHLAVAQVTNLTRTLTTLKERGVWVYGLAVEGTQDFWSVDWTTPSALVVGAEGPGLGRLVRETCDGLIRIPMAAGAVQSLNAATAGSLVLYEAFRQRRQKASAS
jgi:23S rRNA (guanosine2251-2'-O)-methyltransferase